MNSYNKSPYIKKREKMFKRATPSIEVFIFDNDEVENYICLNGVKYVLSKDKVGLLMEFFDSIEEKMG